MARKYLRSYTPLADFLAGIPMMYLGFRFKKTEALYRVGDGIYLSLPDGTDLGKADVIDDRGARRVWHNLTRKPLSHDEDETEEKSVS